jgi:hypothetical protein
LLIVRFELIRLIVVVSQHTTSCFPVLSLAMSSIIVERLDTPVRVLDVSLFMQAVQLVADRHCSRIVFSPAGILRVEMRIVLICLVQLVTVILCGLLIAHIPVTLRFPMMQ